MVGLRAWKLYSLVIFQLLALIDRSHEEFTLLVIEFGDILLRGKVPRARVIQVLPNVKIIAVRGLLSSLDLL